MTMRPAKPGRRPLRPPCGFVEVRFDHQIPVAVCDLFVNAGHMTSFSRPMPDPGDVVAGQVIKDVVGVVAAGELAYRNRPVVPDHTGLARL